MVHITGKGIVIGKGEQVTMTGKGIVVGGDSPSRPAGDQSGKGDRVVNTGIVNFGGTTHISDAVINGVHVSDVDLKPGESL